MDFWETHSGPILERKGMLAIFQKKSKKGQDIRKFRQNCTKFENILKKGSLNIECMKQLEYALPFSSSLPTFYETSFSRI